MEVSLCRVCVGPQRGRGTTAPLGAFFFLLSFSSFWTIIIDPFLGYQSTFLVFPRPWHLILNLASQAFSKSQQLFHGPYLNFSEALQIALQDESLEVKGVAGHTLTKCSIQETWGLLNVRVRSAHDLIEQFILDVCSCTL